MKYSTLTTKKGSMGRGAGKKELLLLELVFTARGISTYKVIFEATTPADPFSVVRQGVEPRIGLRDLFFSYIVRLGRWFMEVNRLSNMQTLSLSCTMLWIVCWKLMKAIMNKRAVSVVWLLPVQSRLDNTKAFIWKICFWRFKNRCKIFDWLEV